MGNMYTVYIYTHTNYIQYNVLVFKELMGHLCASQLLPDKGKRFIYGRAVFSSEPFKRLRKEVSFFLRCTKNSVKRFKSDSLCELKRSRRPRPRWVTCSFVHISSPLPVGPSLLLLPYSYISKGVGGGVFFFRKRSLSEENLCSTVHLAAVHSTMKKKKKKEEETLRSEGA